MEEKRTWRDRFVPGFIREYVKIWKAEGFKELIRQKGWRVVAIVFFYYLIRDSTLYILIPYLIAKGVIGGCS